MKRAPCLFVALLMSGGAYGQEVFKQLPIRGGLTTGTIASGLALAAEIARSQAAESGILANQTVIATGTTQPSTLPNRFRRQLSVLDFAGADPTGVADSSAAFSAAYAASVAGQSIVVPQGRYRIDTPPSGSKTISWTTQSATDVAGADLSALQSTGHLVMTTNRGGNMTIAQKGTNLSLMDLFGGDQLAFGALSSGNSIVGYTVNNAVGAQNFPTGVTGVGSLNAAGGQAFGLYGHVFQYSAGVATNEVDIFNYAGPPAATLPPNRGFGTTDINAIALTVGGGSGTYPSSIGIHVAYSGTSMLTGMYVGADATTNTGIFIDATPTVGPASPFIVKSANTATAIQVISAGAYNPPYAVQTWSAGGSVRSAMTQDGTLYAGSKYRLGGDGTLSVQGAASVGSISSPSAVFSNPTLNTAPLNVINTAAYSPGGALAIFQAGGSIRSVMTQDGTLYAGSAYRLDGTTGTISANILSTTPVTGIVQVQLYGNSYGFGVNPSELTAVSSQGFGFRVGSITGPAALLVTANALTAQGTVIAPLFQGTQFTPASSTAGCYPGQFGGDAAYWYVCTASNVWKRLSLASF